MRERNIDDRGNLEWLVYWSLTVPEPYISMSRGRELLRFETMNEMRDWFDGYMEAQDE